MLKLNKSYHQCFLLLGLLFLSINAFGQIEKIWPSWATNNGTEYVGDKYTATNTTAILKYTYTGVDNFAFGFYSGNTSLTGPNGFRFGISFASGGIGVYVHNSLYTGTAFSMTTGDVLEIKYSNDRFALLRNGVEAYVYDNSGANQSYFLYPYFQDNSNSGLEEGMSWHVEMVASTNPTWYSSGGWRMAKNMLERGQDGGIEMKYSGANSTTYRYAVLQAAKNTNYSSYNIARFYFKPSTRYLYMSARNPKIGHKQSGSWSGSSLYLTTEEMYAGAKVRMAREGSNIVFYVNGKEKKRFNTDANIDVHPGMYRYFTNQENEMRVTFEEGGMCQNYFNSSAFPIQADIDTYYDEAALNEPHNYIYTKRYNGEGEQICHLISESRNYFDEMGRVTQLQNKDILTDKVWATETHYDSYGREAIYTLAAPTGNSRIQYKSNFFRNSSGQAYSTSDYDTPAKLNNPTAVGEQSNTLGWWYSGANTEDPWQATTDFPYSRTSYGKITGAPTRTASPGDLFRMGTGRELVSHSMQAGTELKYVFANKAPLCRLGGHDTYDPNNFLLNQCNSTTYDSKYTKTIVENADGNQVVIFYDQEEREVARAVSGSTSSSASTLKNTSIVVGKSGIQDIQITKRSSYSTTVTFSGSSKNYSIYDLETDAAVVQNSSSSTRSLPAGFYRIQNHNSSNALTLTYQLNYFDFQLDIYDYTGNLVAYVAPLDVTYSTSNPNHKAFTIYKYNSIGEMQWQESPDAGRTNYYQRTDGLLRFSQDAKQAVDGKFTYVKYDLPGRIVEVGECSNFPSGGFTNFHTNNRYYPTSGNAIQTYNLYDIADSGFSITGYTQSNLTGKLSKAWNASETIWYSYDELGRLSWVARQVNGIGSAKITEYVYDLLGNVTEVKFQEGKTDEFRHQYGYDLNGQLKSSATRTDDLVTAVSTVHEQLSYSKDSDLAKRIIAKGLETQTFAYTLDGKTKAINPEDMRVTSIDGGGRNPFSLAIHYHKDDYKPANGLWKNTYNLPNNSATSVYNRYAGEIGGVRWKSRAVNGATDYSGHFGTRYYYNYRGELMQSYFSNVYPYSNSTYEGNSSTTVDYYNYTTYDKNSNIKRNIRYAKNIFPCSSSSLYMDNLTYNYDYTGGKNRLTRIDDSYSNNCIPGEITDQGTNNYLYDELGQLERDVQANRFIEYEFGRVVRLRTGSSASSPLLAEYFYGPDGKRVGKKVYAGSIWQGTWYSYDGNNLQSIYENSNSCGGCNTATQKETPLYGIGKIGMAYHGLALDYHYELTDHLGTVRAVIREGNASETEVVSYSDYYPQGWAMPGRSFSSSNAYRNAYQGQFAEMDEESGWLAFMLRSLDTRVGRWMTVDPFGQYFSPYVAMGNSPAGNVDPDGGCTLEDGTPCPPGTTEGEFYNTGDGWTFMWDGADWIGLGGTLDEVTVTANNGPASGISEDSWVRYIPVVGSATDSYDAFARGDYWTGLFHAGMAVSDVFFVKSLATGLAKAVWRKGAVGGIKKFYGVGASHNYGAAVSRLKKLGLNYSGKQKHHWLITQELMERYPRLKPIGNQAWNLTKFNSHASHMRWAHFTAYPSLGLGKIPGARLLYPISSTPNWLKFGALSGAMRLAE